MTVLEEYLKSSRAAGGSQAYDEFAAPDGTPRTAWTSLVNGLTSFSDADLVDAQYEVARLLADDNVTYTPSPASAVSIADDSDIEPTPTGPQPWRLDPLPLLIEDREWSTLEAGVVQRAELLDAIFADLYGARRLLSSGAIPAAAIFDHDEYLRTVVGTDAVTNQRLFMVAADLGRDVNGGWKVMSDRTQAPSGAGFAMQNRRVVSRVMPEIYHEAHLHRLTPFFQAMRLALVDAAPPNIEDPRVVVLSPGTQSETAFDQAFVASLLGFPLLEGSDLTVRDGRLWMRVLGRLEQVDVVLRRVDSTWMDALELRAGSRLGVTGLMECVRQGTVSVVNNIGSGILENPALLPFLPELCERLLGQSLRLPSVDTWWCGDPQSLRFVRDHLDEIVVRPIGRGTGRSVRGASLSADQRTWLLARIDAAPHRFVGQEVLQLSSAPTTEQRRVIPRNLVLRSFAVRSGSSYSAMLGGLARVIDDDSAIRGSLITDPGGGLAKDVWVIGKQTIEASRIVAPRGDGLLSVASTASAAMVPRVLSDLFWFGRYAERAEDLLRLVLATRAVSIDSDMDATQDTTLGILLQAVTHVSTTYPGFVKPEVAMLVELRSLLLDRRRLGSVAQSLAAMSLAAQGVRDQLSEDVWMVLAEIDRALASLSAKRDDNGLQFTDSCERVLSGLLAVAGIASENMVRDAGWYMLDSGRGLERAQQVLALLRMTIGQVRPPLVESAVTEAVLVASESIVTFRRRYRGRTGAEAVVQLLVQDAHNPRSVSYQLHRLQHDLRAVPNTSPTARPLRLLDSLLEHVRAADPLVLAEPDGQTRPALVDYLSGLQSELRTLSGAIYDQYQQQPPTQQPLFAANRGVVAS